MNGAGATGEAAGGLPWIGRMPADYVSTELPPTAQRILVAAQHLLARDGWRGLTLRRIADEAGEHKSLIIYHFESKSGLLEMLVDSLWHDVDVDLVRQVERLPGDSPRRVEALIDAQRGLALQTVQYQMYWELVPHLMRDRATRERMASLNDSYRDLGVRCLGPLGLPEDQVRPLASFLLAVLDGMGVLLHLVPEAADDDGAYDLLKRILGVGHGVDSGGGTGAGVPAHGREPAPCPAGQPLAPIQSPKVDLGPVAHNLLCGALRVVRRRGYHGLTLEAVARESGEPRSAITYYFGEKRGLELAVLQAMLHEKCRLDTRLFARAAEEEDTLSAVFAMLADILADKRAYKVFFELLPVVLRDPQLLPGQVAFDRWFLQSLGSVLAGCRAPAIARHAPALATLLLASLDGLALQTLLDPRGFEPARSLSVFEHLVTRWAAAEAS